MKFLMSYRFTLFCAAGLGLTGVLLGAMGAHGPLRAKLDQAGTHQNWETAVHYQLTHALALLCAALWLKLSSGESPRRVLWAGHCWALGTLFFCGSIYWLSMGGPRLLGPITPLGGVALLSGWAVLLFEAVWKTKPAA
jgi:uncharacterized membrane protein YgdD (TMEM256/DUF423 family)